MNTRARTVTLTPKHGPHADPVTPSGQDDSEQELVAVFNKYKRKRDDDELESTAKLRESVTAKDRVIEELEDNLRDYDEKVKALEAKLKDAIEENDQKTTELEAKVIAAETRVIGLEAKVAVAEARSAKLEVDNKKLQSFAENVKRLSKDLPTPDSRRVRIAVVANPTSPLKPLKAVRSEFLGLAGPEGGISEASEGKLSERCASRWAQALYKPSWRGHE